MRRIRLGTRGSVLARTQSGTVARAVEARGGVEVEECIVQTSGDRQQDRPLAEIGGKGLFTRELDRALLDGEVDFAVHSLKDLPTEPQPGTVVAAVPAREDPRDALVGPRGRGTSLQGLARGARVGTSSLRRRALLLAFRPDLEVADVRGNLDTRIRKVDDGEYDAIVLAAAGLRRMGLEERIDELLERTAWLPAPAQGALGVVARADDEETIELLRPLSDPATEAAVRAERTLLAVLEGGCRLPIGALGLPYDAGLRLWGMVASPDGTRVVRGDATGSRDDPEALGRELADALAARGAHDVLDEIQESALRRTSHP